MDGVAAPLANRIAEELRVPAPEMAEAAARELAHRHGSAVAAVIFYGSCLRKQTTDGVLDFYVLVDSYRETYDSRALALANAVLPPNVFYCEQTHAGQVLRMKYAVMSAGDFASASERGSLDCRVSSRFCQPAALVYARDDAARRAVVDAVASACVTFVDRMRVWLPATGDHQRFRADQLWELGFHESYRAEFRSESPETVGALHAAAPERYAGVARESLRILETRGRLRLREEGDLLHVTSPEAARVRARVAWRVRRPMAKALAVFGLLKTAFTFGDWVPYVLWKLERHTAVRIQLTERQRRHPLIFGWPVIFRVLRQGLLR